jgi:hypothetical protein
VLPHLEPASAGEPFEQWSVARWRRESARLAPFILVLVLLEGANWYLLEVAFGWVLPGTVLPGLAAAALILVLVGTIFSHALLLNPEMHSHRVRLRATLAGLLALQFLVNTVEGFGVAQVHMPLSAAQFFGLDPVMMARVMGATLGGGLALITFSYLLFVARVLDKMVGPLNPAREAEVVLRSLERQSVRQSAADRAPGAAGDQATPSSADPTIQVRGMPGPATSTADTEPVTRLWGLHRS